MNSMESVSVSELRMKWNTHLVLVHNVEIYLADYFFYLAAEYHCAHGDEMVFCKSCKAGTARP